MGKKTKDIGKNVRKHLASSPLKLMQEITAGTGIEYVRAVDTFIMENVKEAPVKVLVSREGKSIISGSMAWISQAQDGKVEIYLDNKSRLFPTNENVRTAFFYPDKKRGGGDIQIEVGAAGTKCMVCSKPIEIFDNPVECPACGSMGHQLHVEEWVRMKGECSTCQAKLRVEGNGTIVAA